MHDHAIQELRFTNPVAFSRAFDRLLEDPATRLCTAQRDDLTLRVRTDDPAALRLDGRILETPLCEAV